ncbi:hypothetical protein ACS3UN_07075 [Oscillospiraceae bacterium LTW-04]|nr:hypothetical protein RBH76_03285 [Oscillospiraceae bacterium MB24-C1]
MELFKLFGTILVDNKEALNSISQTDGKAKGLMDSVGGGIKAVAGAAVAVGAAASAGAAAMYGMATKAAAATDTIDKMSQKIGVSRTAYQELDFVLSQSGTSVDKMQSGMKSLTTAIDGVSTGNKAAIENFNKLGVSAVDANGNLRNQEDVLFDTIDAFQKMEDGTEKARLAQELFGRTGTELMPLLNGQAGSMEEMRKQAHELGLVIADDAVDAGVKFTDTIDQMKRSFGAAATQVGVKLMPIIQQAASWVIENMPMIQKVVSKVFDIIGSGVSVVVDFIAQLIAAWAEWATSNQETIDAVMAALASLWEWVQELAATVLEVIKAFMDAMSAFWKAHGDEIIAIIEPLWEGVKVIIDTALNVLMALFRAFAALFKGDWSGFWTEIKTLLKSLWDGIVQLVPLLLQAFIKAFELGFSLLFDVGESLFNALWDGLKSVWDGIVSWVSEKVSWLADKLAFWRSGKSQMSEGDDIDGSHATGLSYVPYDGYVAELHQGERVLTADEARGYGQEGGVTIAKLADTIIVREEADIDKIATALHRKIQREKRGRGLP